MGVYFISEPGQLSGGTNPPAPGSSQSSRSADADDMRSRTRPCPGTEQPGPPTPTPAVVQGREVASLPSPRLCQAYIGRKQRRREVGPELQPGPRPACTAHLKQGEAP